MSLKLHKNYWRFGLGVVCLMLIFNVGVMKEDLGKQEPVDRQIRASGQDVFNSFRKFSVEFDASNSDAQQKAIEQEKYEQMLVDDYMISWGMLPASYCFVSVFKLQDTGLIPISFDLVGEQIDSIHVWEDRIGKEGNRILEVKGYSGSGSNQTGIVHLFEIKKQSVKDVWNHLFLFKDTDSQDITTIAKSYYSVLPSKYYNGLNNFSISVIETEQKITGDGNGKILARGKEVIVANPTLYLWNDEAEIFNLIEETP